MSLLQKLPGINYVGGVWGLSKVVAGGQVLLIFFMATTGDIWIILSFRICGYVLHVEHI